MAKATYYLAHTPTFPGYWGKHQDGAHHAIANACDEGANRFGLFIVYSGGESLSINAMGNGIEWDMDEGEPKSEGVYTAAGSWLADSLAELADDLRRGVFEPEEHALDRETVRALKNHK